MAERGLPCATCGKQTLHRQRAPNHILWAILTLFSCGIFGVVWVIDSMKAQNDPWQCATCGTLAAPAQVLAIVGPGRGSVARQATSFVLYVVGFVVVGAAGILGLAWYTDHEQSAEQRRLRDMPYSAPRASGNPTHDKLTAMTPQERTIFLAGYIRADGERCESATSAEFAGGLSDIASRGSAWDVRCEGGVTYVVRFNADAAGTATVETVTSNGR